MRCLFQKVSRDKGYIMDLKKRESGKLKSLNTNLADLKKQKDEITKSVQACYREIEGEKLVLTQKDGYNFKDKKIITEFPSLLKNRNGSH